MKIVIDFYSITDFLSFIVWPPDVAEVTKVRRVNFFKQKTAYEILRCLVGSEMCIRDSCMVEHQTYIFGLPT